MSNEQLIEQYINTLASDETKTGGCKYILVYISKNRELHYSVGNELCFLIDNYDVDDLTPEKALKLELTKANSTVGAIYQRDNIDFKLLIQVGFDNARKQ